MVTPVSSHVRWIRGIRCIVLTAVLLALAAGCKTRTRKQEQQDNVTLAEGYLVLNEPHRARQYFEEALRKDPSNGRARMGMARAALQLGDYRKAMRELRNAQTGHRLAPADRTTLQILLGRSYARLGENEVAWEYLWRVWRSGDVAVKSSLDAEIKTLAGRVPRSTPGVSDVIAFRPPPRPDPPTRPAPSPKPAPQRVQNDHYAFSIYPRRRWKPLPPRSNRLGRMGKPFRITIHHSAHDMPANPQSLNDAADMIRRIQRYHVKNRGWGDIGYHYVIDTNGRAWQARSMAFQGAHAGSGEANRGNIGIVVAGNFDHQRPSPNQIRGLAHLIHQLRARYRIPAWQVRGHAHFKATACPGRYLAELLPQIRSDAAVLP